MIAALAKKGAIGKDGDVPWNIPVHREVDGDTFFPEWREEKWKEVERRKRRILVP